MRFERPTLESRLHETFCSLDEGSKDYIRNIRELWESWSYEERITLLEFLHNSVFIKFSFMEIAILFKEDW